MAADKKDYAQIMAEQVIKALENITAPWVKPWQPGEVPSTPLNPSTGNPYNGWNRVWLASVQPNNDPRWMTWNQAEKMGCRIKDGEQKNYTPIFVWKTHSKKLLKDEKGKPLLDEEGKKQYQIVQYERPYRKVALVYHASQIDGLPELPPPTPIPEFKRHAAAEKILAASKTPIFHDQVDRAFYTPIRDEIHIPTRQQFETPDRYYATTLHEFGHSTGHHSRLNRDLSHPFGSAEYAKEELRAEMFSLMLGQEIGIGHDPTQHHAYIGSWIKVLKKDPEELFRAARDAQLIMNYTHELVKEYDQQQMQDADVSQLIAEQENAILEKEKSGIDLSFNTEQDLPELPENPDFDIDAAIAEQEEVITAREQQIPTPQEKILEYLSTDHGWSKPENSSVSKNFHSGGKGGELNPNGDKLFYITLDKSHRYLTLQHGMNDVLDLDIRDGHGRDPNQPAFYHEDYNTDEGAKRVAAFFNEKVQEWNNLREKTTPFQQAATIGNKTLKHLMDSGEWQYPNKGWIDTVTKPDSGSSDSNELAKHGDSGITVSIYPRIYPNQPSQNQVIVDVTRYTHTGIRAIDKTEDRPDTDKQLTPVWQHAISANDTTESLLQKIQEIVTPTKQASNPSPIEVNETQIKIGDNVTWLNGYDLIFLNKPVLDILESNDGEKRYVVDPETPWYGIKQERILACGNEILSTKTYPFITDGKTMEVRFGQCYDSYNPVDTNTSGTNWIPSKLIGRIDFNEVENSAYDHRFTEKWEQQGKPTIGIKEILHAHGWQQQELTQEALRRRITETQSTDPEYDPVATFKNLESVATGNSLEIKLSESEKKALIRQEVSQLIADNEAYSPELAKQEDGQWQLIIDGKPFTTFDDEQRATEALSFVNNVGAALALQQLNPEYTDAADITAAGRNPNDIDVSIAVEKQASIYHAAAQRLIAGLLVETIKQGEFYREPDPTVTAIRDITNEITDSNGKNLLAEIEEKAAKDSAFKGKLEDWLNNGSTLELMDLVYKDMGKPSDLVTYNGIASINSAHLHAKDKDRALKTAIPMQERLSKRLATEKLIADEIKNLANHNPEIMSFVKQVQTLNYQANDLSGTSMEDAGNKAIKRSDASIKLKEMGFNMTGVNRRVENDELLKVIKTRFTEIESPRIATEKTWLALPYEEIILAKNSAGTHPQGGKSIDFDRKEKRWFALPGADLNKIKQWLPENRPRGSGQERPVNPTEEFEKFLKENGVILDTAPVMNGQKQRCKVEGDDKSQKSGEYCGYENGHPNGWVRNFRLPSKTPGDNKGFFEKWSYTGNKVDRQSQEDWERKNKEIAAQRKAEREAKWERQASACNEKWKSLTTCPSNNRYLVDKGFDIADPSKTFGAKQDNRGNLVLPVRDKNGKLWATQAYGLGGFKQFEKDVKVEGCFHVVGGRSALKENPAEPVIIATGFSTAASIHLATGQPVVVAFSDRNLKAVAEEFRQIFPQRPMLICGDDDRHLPLRQPIPLPNSGREAATDAALAVGGVAVFPRFQPTDQGKAFTDFDDIRRAYGIDSLKRQVTQALAQARGTVNNQRDQEQPENPPEKKPEKTLDNKAAGRELER